MAAPEYSDWKRYVRHIMPRLVPAAELATLPDDGLPERVCAHARTAVLKLASAFSVLITPRGVNWFQYEPLGGRDEVTDDEKDWYAKVTQVVQKELEGGNFYPQLLGHIVDHICAGTGLTLTEADERTGGVVFTHVPAGTYRLAENKYHEIDTVVRKFKYTAHQLAQAFGVEALDADMRKAWESKDDRFRREFTVWHLVCPRDVAPRGNGRGVKKAASMSWASVYIAEGSKKVLAEGGYLEFPYMATRFLKSGNQVYGDSALAGIASVVEDYLEVEESLKEGVKAAVYPRILATPDMAGEIDMRAGGVTLLSPEAGHAGLPREWASAVRNQDGLVALEGYKAEIDAGLFVDQLQTVSNVERQMTAREVVARENEKLMTFSQTFTQFTADFRPLMERVFCVLWRAERFPRVGEPAGLFVPVNGGKGVKVLAPGVKYLGKLSKALESAKQGGLVESLNFAVEMYQATQDVSWLDYFKPYECIKFVTDESNVDVECMRGTSEAKQMAATREQAAAMQQMAAMQEQMSGAARNYAQAERL